MPVRIVCISDTHNYHKSVNLPAGDVLIHAGDSTSRGYQSEIERFGDWLRSLQQYQYKVVISGNHDFGFQDSPLASREWLYGEAEYDHRDGLYYLKDEALQLNVDGQLINFWGSPWQPWFHNWAFNAYPEKLKEKWDLIPKGTDILVTHGPPYLLRDQVSFDNKHVGCRELRQAIQRIKPKLHVCGHIHEGYGVSRFGDTFVANAAICTRGYHPTNLPLVFELHDDGKMRYSPQVPGQEEAEVDMYEVSGSASEHSEAPSISPSAPTSDEGQD